MAADMSKMSCGGGLSLGGRADSGRLSADSGCARTAPEASVSDEGPGSPMATDRRGSGGSAGSPQVTPESTHTAHLFRCDSQRRGIWMPIQHRLLYIVLGAEVPGFCARAAIVRRCL